MSHFNTKNLNGGVEVACQHNIGNFYSAQDQRLNKACFKSFFNKKQNVTFSFNPDTLECNSCGNTHSILDVNSSVYILSDQCFPAVLPAAGDGGCINIIRIENGSLMELARLFVDLMIGVQVRVGSLILLSSVSNLAAVCTAAYAESLVRAGRHIGQSMQGKVTVRVGVPILLGGAEGSSLVRSLHEVAAWTSGLPAASDQFPASARQAFLLTLKNNGVGSTIQAENFTLQLPVNLNSFEKKNFVSNGWDCIYKKN
jgi:hypothetical protein